MKKMIIILGVIVFAFTGCAQTYNSNEVAISNVNVISTYKTGIVTNVKNVVIKDEGSGAITGAIAGAVIGGLFGKGKGSVLASLVGGLSGAYAGHQLNKANAKELYIKLDDGRDIVIIVKGVNIQKGDRVRIIFNGSKIIRVEKI